MKESAWGPNSAWGSPGKNGHKKPDPLKLQGGDSCMVVAVPVVVGTGLALWKLWRR